MDGIDGLKDRVDIKKRILCEEWVRSSLPFPWRSIPPCPCTVTDAENDDIEDSPERSRHLDKQMLGELSKVHYALSSFTWPSYTSAAERVVQDSSAATTTIMR